MAEVSLTRLYLMRAYFLLILVERSVTVMPLLFGPDAPLGPMDGVVYSFWVALALLAAVGIRYPLQMVPLLLVHLVYKTLWLLAVALPLWSAGAPFDPQMTTFTWAMAVGAVLDLIVIPWPYVLAHYIRKPGDRWTSRRRMAEPTG